MADMPEMSLFLDELKKAYRAKIRAAAETESADAVGNRFPWQTRIAVEELLSVAAEKRLPIRMLTGSAPEGFFDESLVRQLDRCVSAGCDVQIVVWTDEPSMCSQALRQWAASKPESVQVRYSKTRQYEDQLPHFLVVGDKACRHEMRHTSFAGKPFTELSPEIPARIHFNDPGTVRRLLDLFGSAWEVCEEPAA